MIRSTSITQNDTLLNTRVNKQFLTKIAVVGFIHRKGYIYIPHYFNMQVVYFQLIQLERTRANVCALQLYPCNTYNAM